MKRSAWQRILFIGLALLMVRCSTTRPVRTTPARIVQPALFWEDQGKRRAFLSDFSGKLQLAYDGKKSKVSGKGRIVGHYPGAFRLELRDPIGRLHYVLTCSGQKLSAQFPRNHQALRDAAGGSQYFRRLLGLAMPFSDLVAFFSGVLPPIWEKKTPSSWEWDPQKGAYRGVLEQGGAKLTFWVDSENLSLDSFVWEGSGEKIEAQYRGFEPCCGSGSGSAGLFQLANEVQVKIPSQETAVEVNWGSLAKPNQEIPSAAFEFTPAPTDKVTDLK